MKIGGKLNAGVKSVKLRLPRVKLNTTLDPVSIGDDEFAELMNCLTEQKIVRLGKRPRRWAEAPRAQSSYNSVTDWLNFDTVSATGSTWGVSTGTGDKVAGAYSSVITFNVTSPGNAVGAADSAFCTIPYPPAMPPDPGTGITAWPSNVTLNTFGFSIPVGAVVTGVTLVSVTGKVTGLATGVQCTLINGADGSPYSSSVSKSTGFTGTSAEVAVGTQFGSLTASASEIMSANFSVAVMATGTSVGTFLLDSIKLKVDYTMSPSADDIRTADGRFAAITSASAGAYLWAQGDFESEFDPAAVAVTGVEIQFVGKMSAGTTLTVQLGNAAGTLYGTAKTLTLTTANDDQIAGGPTDLWGATSIVLPWLTGGTKGLKVAFTTGDSASIDQILIRFYYTSTFGATTSIPAGVAVAQDEGGANVYAIQYGGLFNASASGIATASGQKFGSMIGSLNTRSDWSMWQWAGRLFMSSEAGGVWHHEINADYPSVEKLWKSYSSSNVASYLTKQAPAYDVLDFDSGDTYAGGSDSIGTPTVTVTSPTATSLKVAVTNPTRRDTGMVFAEITFASARDLSSCGFIGISICAYDSAGTSKAKDGYHSLRTRNYIEVSDATAPGGKNTIYAGKLTGAIDKFDSDGEGYVAWYDLSDIPIAQKDAVTKIKIAFGVKLYAGTTYFAITPITMGGIFYKRRAGLQMTTGFPSDPTSEALEYAYSYTEGGVEGPAKALTPIKSFEHLGTAIVDGKVPKMGSLYQVTVPIGGTPYTGSATINLYRKVAEQWWRVTTQANTSQLVYEDRLTDSDIIANSGGTYTNVGSLIFDTLDPKDTGQVTGVSCGCAWKGHNVACTTDGVVRFSKNGDYREVYWEGVTDIPTIDEDDYSRARSFSLTSRHSLPGLAIVGQDVLYVFTKVDGYAIVGDNAVKASLPKQIAGVRGVVARGAAIAHLNGAMYASADGLWYVECPASVDAAGTVRPEEITKDARSTWTWLLNSSPSTVKMCGAGADVFVFNGLRFLHIDKDYNINPGLLEIDETVEACCADPEYGIIVQLSDGTFAVFGDYPTDGGTNLAGSNGQAVEWHCASKRWQDSARPIRVNIEASFLASTDTLTVYARGSAYTTPGLVFGNDPLDRRTYRNTRAFLSRRSLGRSFDIYAVGTGTTTMKLCELEVTPGNDFHGEVQYGLLPN